MRYAIIIENAGSIFSACAPDLPGCIATGSTLDETAINIRETVEFHIAGLREAGLPLPLPTSPVEYIEIAA